MGRDTQVRVALWAPRWQIDKGQEEQGRPARDVRWGMYKTELRGIRI